MYMYMYKYMYFTSYIILKGVNEHMRDVEHLKLTS